MPLFDVVDDILKIAGRSFGALKSLDDLAGFLSPDTESSETDSSPDSTGDSRDPSDNDNGNEGSTP